VLGTEVIDNRLAGLDAAPISDKARAMLPLLERVTRDHAALAPGDFDEVRALGVTEEAITDALYVAYLFNIINRMADALVFEVGPQAAFDSGAKSLLTRGYKL
jgi:alkylhydroperoxidase family enzyme